MFKHSLILAGMMCLAVQPALAANKTVSVHSTKDENKSLGTVTFKSSPYGVVIVPVLKNLKPGLHGFHLPEKADCSRQGMAAGSHYDPNHTNSHQGPYGKGHLGDLPVLYVNKNGMATIPVLAPRLSMDDLNDISLMIHQGGDNYSDNPALGGGGKRVGCGVIKKGE